MGRFAGAAVFVALTVAALAAGQAPAPGAPAAPPRPADLSVKAIVAAGTTYVETYARKMTSIIGQETYTQEQYDSVDHRIGSRLMRGELFLTFLPADGIWIAVHDIGEVDGSPVPDKQSLQTLLSGGALRSIVSEVTEHNAQFNLGRIRRTFNEPTLALLVLDKRHTSSFTFTRKDVRTVNDRTLVTLEFTEKNRPTLVVSETGNPVYSKGELLLEAATGCVWSTHMFFKYGAITADLVTQYEKEPRLNLVLPMAFTERYEGSPEGLKEIDIGRAQYGNYRRFETSGRIKGTDEKPTSGRTDDENGTGTACGSFGRGMGAARAGG